MLVNNTIDSLAKNASQETWMDTLFEGDGRQGARIEIQALRLCMYDFLYKTTQKAVYKEIAAKLQDDNRNGHVQEIPPPYGKAF